MTPLALLEFVLALLAAAIVLSLIASRLALPSAAALVIGGIALALAPGAPNVEIDPDLIMLLFLPPLLLASAYFTVWRDFSREWWPISLLALGAVTFTTFGVAWVAHLVAPSLPWAACVALGAIVSPPDAVAAKSVLQQLRLPRRLVTILEGESLVNDASGLVLYKFAVAAALTGTFHLGEAMTSFVWLAVGGVLIGFAMSMATEFAFKRLHETNYIIVTSFLAAYASYIAAETVHASGVLSVVTCGILMGWRQHEVLDAQSRTQAKAVWQLVVFVLEALVFVLIGLALRGVLTRKGGDATAILNALPVALAVTGAVIVLRLIWVFAAAYLPRLVSRAMRSNDPLPSVGVPFIIGWAGMRGVVSLAAALALPIDFPGRDTVLFASFMVIIVTVLVQGVTLGPLIRLFGISSLPEPPTETLSEAAARAAVAEASLKAIEQLVHGETGALIHPRLVDDYRGRARATARLRDEGEHLLEERRKHFTAALHAVTHGRAELIRLHRSGKIHDSILHSIETELDLEELRFRRFIEPGDAHAPPQKVMKTTAEPPMQSSVASRG
ncbi:MAG: Na+/H+ antiporter [Beijerinckiaceae bacterium]|nr:Na+/H+ antiporter [Beijerinckiaceae bacterium]